MKNEEFYIDFLNTGSITDYLHYKGIWPSEGDEDGLKTGCGDSQDQEHRK